MSTRLSRKKAFWFTAGSVVTVAVAVLVAVPAGGRYFGQAALTSETPVSGAAPAPDLGGAERSQLVRTTRPTREPLKRTTSQPAHVEAYEAIDVHAKVSGYVLKLGQVRGPDGRTRDVDLGDRVEKDQVLVQLWVPEMEQEHQQKQALVEKARAEVTQAEAALESAAAQVSAAAAKIEEARAEITRAEAEVAYRQVEHERYQRMLQERTARADLAAERHNQHQAARAALTGARAALTTAEANLRVERARQAQAQADVESARARQKVAEANREQARILLEYGKVRAPFAGVLTSRRVDTGAFVQSAAAGTPEPLFMLQRVDRLRILTDIPEADSAWVALGQPATLRIDALRGQVFTGRVVRHADALDASTRTLRVEVELDKRPAGLRPGMFGNVTVVLADFPTALLLPTSALVASSEKPTVMVVKAGRAQRQEIQIGLNDGVRMQVVGGLNGDDLVITDGKDGVREGQLVELAR